MYFYRLLYLSCSYLPSCPWITQAFSLWSCWEFINHSSLWTRTTYRHRNVLTWDMCKQLCYSGSGPHLCWINKSYRDTLELPKTQRLHSSDRIVFCRNSRLQLSEEEEAGRGAAGPVISHSWLTVMTDFSCPTASAFKAFHTQLATHSHNWLPKNKVVWRRMLGEVCSGKRVLLWNQQEHTAQRQQEAAERLQLHSNTEILRLWKGLGLLLSFKSFLFN